ncbi:uncharacterized protein [Paramormyrops kingsleyae]|uniref:uncharacterized protein isoform X2 n=1 Tax=Paramormyrops kingsleyae TaxID=1676925 RepID=UPI003B96AED9
MGVGTHILAHILVVHVHSSHGMHLDHTFVESITETHLSKQHHWLHSDVKFVYSQNFCPPYPAGETQNSLEGERVSLLSEVKKRRNNAVIKEKYRRQEVVRDKPMIAEFKTRWPGLFTVPEVEAEFLMITTVPLITTFFAQLDHHADQLIRVLKKTGGSKGKKIDFTFAPTSQNETVEKKRECLLRAHCIYLNEDPSSLFQEYLDSDGSAAQRDLEQVVFGIYSINAEGGDGTNTPVDVGIVIEGVEVLQGLGDIASACALLMGVIYAMNLSYPQELKTFFEVLQKIFLQLDATRLSTKICHNYET